MSGQFLSIDGWTKSFAISAGVVPDDTFPADLVLSKGMFHKWSILCNTPQTKFDKETVTLTNFTDSPTLEPDYRIPKTYNVKTSLQALRKIGVASAFLAQETAALQDTKPTVHWGKGTPTDNQQVSAWLAEYERRFPGIFDAKKRKTKAITKLSRVRHDIDTGDAVPFRDAPRRYSPAQEHVIREFVKKHEGTLVRKSKGPWASNSHLVPKKHHGQTTKPDKNDDQVIWRFCCDYRRLNAATKKHAHPLPNTMDQIQQAAGYESYAFIDLLDGFWHVLMTKEASEKSAFMTPNGLYE